MAVINHNGCIRSVYLPMVIARPLSTERARRILKKLEPSNWRAEPLSPTADKKAEVVEDVDIVENREESYKFEVSGVSRASFVIVLVRPPQRFSFHSPTLD